MKSRRAYSNDYFKLFFKREGKVVLGRHYSNMWLLTAVLSLTFLAIAFSNASLNYLSFKMNDPFINWVDIQNDYGEGDLDALLLGLSDTVNMKRFHFINHQVDYTFNFNFFGKDEAMIQYPSCRFFQSFKGNPLIKAILDKDNVVGDLYLPFEELYDDMIGVIVSQDLVRKLGYDECPPYIDICRYGDGADTLGFKLYKNNAHLPVPVIAVVKRLPMNVDIIATRYFYEQQRNDLTYPFYIGKREYATTLYYFVPNSIDQESIISYIEKLGGRDVYVGLPNMDKLKSYQSGYFVSMEGKYGEIEIDKINEIHNLVMDEYGDKGIYRIFNYTFKDYNLPQGSYISVQFQDLNFIREFESFVKEHYKVKIEMSQINAKENFNAVTVMANILSWAIIIFSLICIMLFVINLLQSYFQKVKRNLGTFKAFGISNTELISVYVLIMLVTIFIALLIALIIIYSIELLLPQLGILKDDIFNYLSLWSPKTYASIGIIILSTILTVYVVMRTLLSATPGDLIYDRK